MKTASKQITAPSSSVKLEVLTFRRSEPAQPIRFEFGPLKETFNVDIPIDLSDGTTKQITWKEWKQRAIDNIIVRNWFKPNTTLLASEFALKLPPIEWIGPDSIRDELPADTEVLLRAAGASRSNSSILLLYVPQIHICTFDGIQFSAACFGHWLSASDTKTLDRLRKPSNTTTLSSSESTILYPNDYLLKESHVADFARLLYRISLFMKEDLVLNADQYIVSVPFGEYIFADGDFHGRDEIRARVQITDARVFWTLILKFEEKLNDDDRGKRLQYFIHQRQNWLNARSLDYSRWATEEAVSVRAALDELAREPPAGGGSSQNFKLPKHMSWDDYGRMQLCVMKMEKPICDMGQPMGAVSEKLKSVVTSVQTAAQMTRSGNINLSARSDQCLVLIPADKYMKVLTRVSADARAWGAALLDALRETPDRLYSGLLSENPSLFSSCNIEDLSKIDECLKSLAPRPIGFKGIVPRVDTSALPLSVEVIKSLETKNHTDKRLFLERYPPLESLKFSASGTSDRPSSTVSSASTVWDKLRAQQQAPPTTVAPPKEETIRPVNPPTAISTSTTTAASVQDDFARFDGITPSTHSNPPTAVKSVLQRPHFERPYQNDKFGQNDKFMNKRYSNPPRTTSQEGDDQGESNNNNTISRRIEKQPPPQAVPGHKQQQQGVGGANGPFPRKTYPPRGGSTQQGQRPARGGGHNRSSEQDRDWRTKPIQTPSREENPHYSVSIPEEAKPSALPIDREDRAYESGNTTSAFPARSPERFQRGRRGGGRGGHFSNRGGGRGGYYKNNSQNPTDGQQQQSTPSQEQKD